LSEVAFIFGKLQNDHKELKDELTALEKVNLGPEAAGHLKKAKEQQREAEDHITGLRRLLEIDVRERRSPS